MGVRPLILAAHFIFAGAGLIAAWAVGPIVADRIHPAQPRWVVLNTACWVAASWAYNDTKEPSGVVADYASHLSSLLNFVWCDEYSGAHRPIFTNLGQGGYLDSHLIWIYRVASAPDVEAIIYANAPGAIGAFLDSGSTLAAIPVLERIRREYPEAASDVNTYLECLYASEGYRRAVAEYGSDWRDRLDPQSATLRPRSGQLKARLKNIMDVNTEFISNIKTNKIDEYLQLPALGRDGPRMPRRAPGSAKVVALLDQCAVRYLNPANQKLMKHLMKEDFWNAAGGEAAWDSWANIVAKICKARKIKLIYYIPPQLQATQDEYLHRLRPEYIDRVRQSFNKYDNVLIIDNSRGDKMCKSDILWHFYEGLGPPGGAYNPGQIPNVIGKLKSARFIIKAIVEAGLLHDRGVVPRYLGSAWPGEESLPPTGLTLDYLPESVQRKFVYYVETDEARARSSKAVEHPASPSPPLPSTPPGAMPF